MGPIVLRSKASPDTIEVSMTRWWRTPRGAAAIVAGAALLAFAGSLANDFTYDEGQVIVGAQRFLQSGSYGTLFSPGYFAHSLEGTWRPVVTFTYMLDAAVSMHPAVFKVQSLLWHIAAAWLLMALVRRLLPARQSHLALVAGLFFVLHPVTTETVDNASFREDSLVTVFVLATLLLALDGRRVAALVCYGLGLLSKESAVVAPALLGILWLTGFQGRPARPPRAPVAPPARPRLGWIARELAPYGVLTVVYLALRFGPMNTPLTYAQYAGGTFGATLVGLPAIWAHYLRLMVWPWPLSAEYTGYFQFGRQPWLPVALASAMVLAYLALIGLAVRRGAREVALGLGWFLVALLPVSNLLPIPIPAAERFLYLPLCGIALAVAGTFARLVGEGGRRARLASTVLGAWLALFAVLTNLRHRDWRDDHALWLATVAVNPRSCGAQSAVGGSLLSQGMATGDAGALREAVRRERLALELCPDASEPYRAAFTYTRLGAAEALLGNHAQARAALERAMALHPRLGLPVAWLGYVAYLDGDAAGAATLLKRAIIDLGPPDSTVAAVARLYVDKL
jgi:protein O-mannosyl-transferase